MKKYLMSIYNFMVWYVKPHESGFVRFLEWLNGARWRSQKDLVEAAIAAYAETYKYEILTTRDRGFARQFNDFRQFVNFLSETGMLK